MGIGAGGSFSFAWPNLIFPNVEVGVSTGFYYLTGKKSSDSEIQKTSYGLFAPLTASLGYRVYYTERFSMIPYIFGGGAYLDIPYTERDSNTLMDTTKHLRDFGPVAGAGLSFDYEWRNNVILRIHLEQGMLIKKAVFDYPYTRMEIAAGWKL